MTMNKDREELRDVDIHISNGAIKKIGSNLKKTDDLKVFDGSQSIVTPGLINTHDHLFQSLTKAVPGVQNVSLFDWLKGLYPIWGKMNPEQVQLNRIIQFKLKNTWKSYMNTDKCLHIALKVIWEDQENKKDHHGKDTHHYCCRYLHCPVLPDQLPVPVSDRIYRVAGFIGHCGPDCRLPPAVLARVRRPVQDMV